MKKLIIALVSLFTITVSANAMSYEQARQQALFLTDKMAYELNLTDDQYEAAYEVNLDYLMSIDHHDNLYGVYWERRNLDLSYILLDWQYRMYRDATYFYRPLYWDAGYWHFGVYARYPRRDYFYFGVPRFYAVYRGGHSWHMNGNRSWYHGRNYGPRRGYDRIGMRDGFNRGHYNNGSRSFGNGPSRTITTYGNGNTRGNIQNAPNNARRNGSTPNSSFGSRQSSTRTTVTRPNTSGNGSRGNSSFGGRREGNAPNSRAIVPNNRFTPDRSSGTRSSSSPSRSYSAPSRSYSAPSRSYSSPSRSGGNSMGTRGSVGAPQNNGGGRSFGGRR